MADTPACLAALENEIWRLDRERPMLAKRHWYMEQGMPATAHYLDAAKVLHDAAPDLIAKARRVDAVRNIASGHIASMAPGPDATPEHTEGFLAGYGAAMRLIQAALGEQP